jgi:predicted Zn-dependent protease
LILQKRIGALATVAIWLASICLVFPPADAWAQRRGGGPTLLRDAEAEDIIRHWATPLFTAAGLQADAVQVFLVQSSDVNAFVAGGQRIFIHSGLLLTAENANQIMGVIAHETGHISGGHLARLQDELRGLTAQSIIALVAGAAAAVASGRPDAGMAAVMGAQHLTERNLLQYSRVQESAADQAGISFLERTQKSGQGMLRFLEILGEQELLSVGQQDPYVRSHPLSRERINLLKEVVARSRWAKQPDSPEDAESFARLRAKLLGYIDPAQTLRLYPVKDASLPGRYARAVAYYRSGDAARSIAELDSLLAERPNDPYFLEQKAQTLHEGGRPTESLPFYRRAVELAPEAATIRIALGQALLAIDGPTPVEEAIEQLRLGLRREPQNGSGWAFLAQAYGRAGDVANASLASAEQFLLAGRWRDAILQAGRAEAKLPVGSPGQLRAQDIKGTAENELKKDKNKDRR